MTWTAETDCRHGRLEYPRLDQYVGRSLELYGEHSKEEGDAFAELLQPGDTVVEVGANIGAHTVGLCKMVGPTGRVIAIEPQRVLYGLLFKNLFQNGCSNSTPVHAACGRGPGVLSVPVVDYSKAGNFGGIAMEPGGPGEAVPVITVDSLGLDDLKLLKIDVEGMELEVLLGARETIRAKRPLLYVENDREDRSAELIACIHDMGYRLWWHVTPLYSEDNFKGNKENAWPGMVSINMLCVPRECEAQIPYPRVQGPHDDWRQIHLPRPAPTPEKPRAAVVRLGAFGDSLYASSLFPHLKEQGYHVTVYTGDSGMQVLKHDPHIDEFVHVPDGKIPLGELGQYFHHESAKYDRWIQLLETVENYLLLDPRNWRFKWPKGLRHDLCNRNYLEFVHDVAGVPHEFRQRFYPSQEEREWASAWRREIPKLVVLAISGSAVHKWYPHWGELAASLLDLYPDLQIVVQGDDRGAQWPVSSRLHRPQWTIREAMTMCVAADLVIGMETGLLNAVALEDTAKIVLLSHSTAENLTKHWRNTVALHGEASCYPCHRTHFTWEFCHRVDSDGGPAPLCQSTISPQEIRGWVRKVFPLAQRHEQSIAA